MTEITLARHAWARIALAGVNTRHPGPSPGAFPTWGRCECDARATTIFCFPLPAFLGTQLDAGPA